MATPTTRCVWLLVQLVAMWACLSAGPTSIECRRHLDRGHRRNATTATPERPADEQATGESRIEGGLFNSSVTVPPYIATLWSTEDRPKRSDGKYIGLGHILNEKNDFIMHTESYGLMNNSESSESKWQPPNTVFSNVTSFNVHDGIPGEYKSEDITFRGSGLGDTAFSFFRVKGVKPARGSISSRYPTLESNKSELGKDCMLYGFTELLRDHGPDKDVRKWVRYPVKADKCEGVKCRLETMNEGDGVCGQAGDLGSPVMCGPEEKLTYLVTEHNRGAFRCSSSFNANHVAHMLPDIKDMMGK